jgi:ureidoglycolate hydrolase
MNERLLEIREFKGDGYKPLVDYDRWRVAILRYIDELEPERIDKLERHTQTDEVFVLLHGLGVLLMGGNEATLDVIHPQVLEPGKIYNVKCNAWHNILLSRDASVLLVENRDTGALNTDYARLTPEQKHSILEIARHFSDTTDGDKLF